MRVKSDDQRGPKSGFHPETGFSGLTARKLRARNRVFSQDFLLPFFHFGKKNNLVIKSGFLGGAR